ncbi:MAG TPA: hypothetical protein VK420_04580 [Longimicrobium sp.]|nr:hypothetical protein [Longimicrobium sp.]
MTSRKSSEPKKQQSRSNARTGRRLWYLAAPLILIGGAAFVLWGRGEPEAPAASAPAEPLDGPKGAAVPPRPPPPRLAAAPAPGMPAPAEAQDPEAQRRAELELWRERLERARHSLDSYRESTKYPHESRPISEHPDQVYPNQPIDSEQAFAKQGQKQKPGSDTRLKVRQDRVYVVGDEAVRFSVAAVTGSGLPLPLRVTMAQVAPAPDDDAPPSNDMPQPLAFNDEGQNGDEVARDGTLTALLVPSRSAFARHAGTLRIFVQMRAGEEEGETFFDIIYTPAPPAQYTGKVREAVEQGSLNLYLGVLVKKPGRYVVSGRVDDAAGKPFAMVTFNEELAEGAREVKLQVFGKLIRDQRPAFPLKLRDVDAFLLKEDTFPDRELLPRLVGYAHTTRAYPEAAFSDAEWQSEERDRYLNEFTKDVKEAEQQISSRQK